MSSTDEAHDVIVIGAGLAGLSAALMLQKADLKVVVLEAQDRVGGRTLSETDAEFGTLDLGGHNIPPNHRQLINLAHELDVESFSPKAKNTRKIWLQNNVPTTYFGHYPRFWNPFINLDFNNAIRNLNHLISQISVDEPWTSHNALYLDSLSVKEWVQINVWTRTVQSFFVYACRVNLVISDPSQCSMLYFLWFLKQFSGLISFFPSSQNIEEARSELNFKGGCQQVCINAAARLGSQCVQLNSPVTSIEQTHDSVVVSTENGKQYTARYVIMAISPAVFQRVNFTPLLPQNRLATLNAMQPSTGRLQSYLCYAEKLKKSGDEKQFFVNVDETCPTIHGVYYVVEDKSVICCVSNTSVAGFGNLTPEERQKTLCQCVQRAFGSDVLLHPVKYVEKDWVRDKYALGCTAGILPPGILTKYKNEYKKPFGQIYFAGDEMSHKWNSQMGGAVISGQSAAKAILYNLGYLSADKLEEEPLILHGDVLPPYYYNSFIRCAAPSVGSALAMGFVGVGLSIAVGGLWLYKVS